ncbi:hypothetical protein U6G28_10075 [Actinomycetaceae bacterium MB13-C1-2]|nr:hypothetical protein U6G28_10075 [Actinomycetaceae bacterium MB13-C1-2]
MVGKMLSRRGIVGSGLAGSLALLYGTSVGGKRTDVVVPVTDSLSCQEVLIPIRVVYGLPKWAYPRGGVCVGRTFLTGRRPTKKILQHEARHVLQWRRHGLTMPIRYWAAGSDPFTNRFEIEADLDEGGYCTP